MGARSPALWYETWAMLAGVTPLPTQMADTRSRSVSNAARRSWPRSRMRPRGVRLSAGQPSPVDRASSTEEMNGKPGSTKSAHGESIAATGGVCASSRASRTDPIDRHRAATTTESAVAAADWRVLSIGITYRRTTVRGQRRATARWSSRRGPCRLSCRRATASMHSSGVRFTCLLVVALLALAQPVSSHAQAPRRPAGIQGTVTDSSAGVLPGVTVTASLADRRLVGTTVTDARGEFVLSGLPAGIVNLTFQLSGFEEA